MNRNRSKAKTKFLSIEDEQRAKQRVTVGRQSILVTNLLKQPRLQRLFVAQNLEEAKRIYHTHEHKGFGTVLVRGYEHAGIFDEEVAAIAKKCDVSYKRIVGRPEISYVKQEVYTSEHNDALAGVRRRSIGDRMSSSSRSY